MRPRRRATPYLLVAPAMALFTFAVLGPIVATAGFSFFDWNGFGPFDPVGFANYVRAATDPIFRGLVPPRRHLHRPDDRPRGVRRAAPGRSGHRPSAGDRVLPRGLLHPRPAPHGGGGGALGLRLQPRFRPGQLGVGGGRTRRSHQGLAGGHRHGTRRGVGGLGLGLRRLLHGHLLRRLQADTQRSGRGGADRRGERDPELLAGAGSR